MKTNELVRINKEMNLNKVELEEGFQNLYVNIIQRINGMEKYEHIRVSKADLIKLLGTNSRNTEYLHDIFVRLTGSNEIKIGDKKIYGSIFSAKAEKDGSYLIAVNAFYKEFLFTKSDIDLMYKVKNYKHLPLNDKEAEQWHKSLKEKKKFLMILNNASIKILRGKNNKIIYSMLREFAGSIADEGEHKGESYRRISYKEFKESLQLSPTYRNDNIEKILARAKKDITELTELTISEIKTFPEKLGRGVKKEYMIIYFFEKPEAAEKKKTVRKKKSKSDIDIINQIITIPDEDIKPVEMDKAEADPKISELKELIKNQISKMPLNKRYEILAKLIPMKTENEIMDFIAIEKLEINFKLLQI